METSLMVYDYPTPNEESEHTMKVECTFTTFVTVYGDDPESWEQQLKEMKQDDLLYDAENVEIQDYEKV